MHPLVDSLHPTSKKAAAHLLSGRSVYIVFLTIPAKAMLYGAPSNRRVTCFRALKMYFNKPATRWDQQVDLLRARGMIIPDTGRALHYLSHISYYRLRATGSRSRPIMPPISSPPVPRSTLYLIFIFLSRIPVIAAGCD